MGLFKKEEPLEEYERFSARRQLMEDLTLTKNALTQPTRILRRWSIRI